MNEISSAKKNSLPQASTLEKQMPENYNQNKLIVNNYWLLR
jgi:hypothetical protein